VPARRFLGIWHPHGAAPGYWSPLQEGADFEFSFITKPLEPFRKYVTLISGMDMPEAMATTEEPGGDHARGAVLLSSMRPRRNAVSPYLGVTVDQLVAKKYGRDTILESIQLAVEEDGNYGNCNWGYSCAYTNSISWTSPVQPLPTEVNPRVAFERLFGDGTSPEERKTGRKQDASILDSVAQQISYFKKPLGAMDRARLDTYLENIREIERRIRIATEKTDPGAFRGDSVRCARKARLAHYRLMYDLLALAFEGDLTRSATLHAWARTFPARVSSDSGFTGGWHGSSHHGDKPENVANYAKMNRYHVQNLAYFAEKLSKIPPTATARVLDHILIYKGSNMGNSHRHAHVKVPDDSARRDWTASSRGTATSCSPTTLRAHVEYVAGRAAQVRH
jgi:hypothetical protein